MRTAGGPVTAAASWRTARISGDRLHDGLAFPMVIDGMLVWGPIEDDALRRVKQCCIQRRGSLFSAKKLYSTTLGFSPLMHGTRLCSLWNGTRSAPSRACTGVGAAERARALARPLGRARSPRRRTLTHLKQVVRDGGALVVGVVHLQQQLLEGQPAPRLLEALQHRRQRKHLRALDVHLQQA
jgi:hypothetical protein